MAERTDRQKAGDAAESLVCERLTDRGWRILARNAHFGRSVPRAPARAWMAHELRGQRAQ